MIEDLLEAIRDYDRAMADYERQQRAYWLEDAVKRHRGRVDDALRRIIDERIRELVVVRSSSGE